MDDILVTKEQTSRVSHVLRILHFFRIESKSVKEDCKKLGQQNCVFTSLFSSVYGCELPQGFCYFYQNTFME